MNNQSEKHRVNMETRHSLPDALLTASVFGMIASVVLAIQYVYNRFGYTQDWLPVVSVLGVAFFVLCAPPIILNNRFQPAGWWLSPAAVVLYALLLVALIAWLAYHSGIPLGIPLTIIGWSFGLVIFSRWLRRDHLLWSLLFVLIVGFIFSTILTERHAPLILESILFGGGHIDNFFHASYTNILVTYGVPSTGLDGTVAIPYHFLSHWLFGHLAHLTGVHTLDFYMLGYPVIFVSLTFFSIILFVVVVRTDLKPGRWLVRRDVVFWLLFFVVLYDGFAPGLVRELRIDTMRIVRSESQNVSVGLTFLIFSITWVALRARAPNQSRAFMLVIPIMVGLLGFVKGSQVMLLMMFAGYFYVRLGFYRYRWGNISAVLALMAFAFVFLQISSGRAESDYQWIEAFHFYNMRIPHSVKPSWFLFFFLWSWLFVGLRLGAFRRIGELIDAVRQRRLLDVELILVACAGSFAIVSVVAFDSGASFFYVNFQRWLALALLLVYLPFVDLTRIRQVTPAQTAIAVTSILFLLGAYTNANERASEMFAKQRSVRLWTGDVRQGLRQDVTGWLSGGFSGLPLGASLRSLEEHPNFPILAELRSIYDLPESEKRQNLLYIPANDPIWSLHPECNTVPLLISAVSGMALLDGVPDANCSQARHYGYGAYELPTPQVRLTDAQVCQAAQSRGFDRIIVLQHNDSRHLDRETRICDT